MLKDGDVLPYAYRVTKYDPADRDEHEHPPLRECAGPDPHARAVPGNLDAPPYAMEADGGDVQPPGDDDFWAGLHLRARWQTEPTPSDRNWAFLKTLHRGEIVTGRVTRIAGFGVTFVDISGFEAMINIPELSWRPINHPSDVVAVGQEISAEILDVDPIRERVSLSLKALHEDPMPLLAGQIGQTIVGRVTKLVPFGAFARIEEMENGFEGLVHNSELADGYPDHPQPVVHVGDALPVKILAIDPVRRRISLSHRQAISADRDESVPVWGGH